MPLKCNALLLGKTEAEMIRCGGEKQVEQGFYINYQSKCYATDYTVLGDLASI